MFERRRYMSGFGGDKLKSIADWRFLAANQYELNCITVAVGPLPRPHPSKLIAGL